ncbi:hypothetical protein JHK62_02130 [Streptococcus sp. CSL7591-lung]|uniref:Uncharacterized protein n=2 Tax=Streptococcus pacificus TaxID=2740577 RepID=A0ABS0ZHK6_9STRE|nr:hypothetical protein [Streptococcus pacificus]
MTFSLNNSKIEEDNWKKEQEERVALYLINNFDLADGSDIEEIEVVDFEKNSMTGTWWITLCVNNKYNMDFSLTKSNNNLRTSHYSPIDFIDKTTIGTLTELPVKLKYIK